MHERQGGIKLFLQTVATLMDEPKQLHCVSSFAWKMEMEIHEVEEANGIIYACWRKKIGSNKVASKIFDYLDPPTCLQNILAALIQQMNKQIRGLIQKIRLLC